MFKNHSRVLCHPQEEVGKAVFCLCRYSGFSQVRWFQCSLSSSCQLRITHIGFLICSVNNRNWTFHDLPQLGVQKTLQSQDADECNILTWHDSFLHQELTCLQFGPKSLWIHGAELEQASAHVGATTSCSSGWIFPRCYTCAVGFAGSKQFVQMCFAEISPFTICFKWTTNENFVRI